MPILIPRLTMWSTENVELKRIDELLHCGICYEYMDTSVITSCSHSYCSLCIRKYLHYKTQCPVCSEETFEKDLRKNKLLDEIIVHYLNFKEKCDKRFHCERTLLAGEKEDGIACPTDNLECKKERDALNAVEVQSDKSFDSPTIGASKTIPCGRKDYQQDMSSPSTSTDLRIPLMFTPKGRKDFRKEENRQMVKCPVCSVEVPQNNINRHLDDCLKRENAKDRPKENKPQRKPLPKLVLSLMKDSGLRKRLKELGLSSQGDRKALESRLQRYTVLYNAECDKTFPRPVLELIKQCEEEENLEKKVQKPTNRLNVNRNVDHNIIEQQRKKYLATNKDSFDQLISQVKHANDPRKESVRRNILNQENLDTSHNNRLAENNSIKNDQRTNFLSLNSTNYIDDSDSNISCPLQSYSSEDDPMNFLTVELSTLSDDSIDQCASNHNISNRPNKSSPDLLSPNIKTENIQTEKLPSENILIREEIISNNQSSQCDVLENAMDIDTKKSVSKLIKTETENEENKMDINIKKSVSELIKTESENGEQAKLSERSKSGTKHNSDKCIAHSERRDKWQKELHNENVDSITEDMEYFVEDNDNIDEREDYERSKHEQLNKVMEEYASDGTKFAKENVKTLNKDLTTWALRKREREKTLSDEEKIADRAMKSLRLGLSEAKGFNNENFDETALNEEKSQCEKEQSVIIRTNNIRNFARKSVRLRNKMSNDTRKLTR